MKEDPERVVLMGYGCHGQRMAHVLKERVSVIIDTDPDRREQAKQDHPHVRVCNSLEDVTAGECGVLVEESSIRGRREAHQWARENHVPAVLEKPLTLDTCRISDFASGQYTVNFHERLHPVIVLADELIARRSLHVEAITAIRANPVANEKYWHSGHRDAVVGGSLVDKGIHDLANFTTLLRASPICPSDPIVNRLINGEARQHSQPCDLYADISFMCQHHGQPSTLRLISSWVGLPPQIMRHIEETCPLPSHANGANPPPCVPALQDFSPVHCKLFVVDFVSRDGTERLVGSTLERGQIKPYLLHSRSDNRSLEQPTASASSRALLRTVRRASTSTEEDIRDILGVHRAILGLRDKLLTTRASQCVELPVHFAVG